MFRTALALALVGALALAVWLLIEGSQQPAGQPTASIGAVTQLSVPGLESGACVRFEPTQGRLNKTVFIDPGHGGLDPGVVGATSSGATVREKDATLAVATRLASLLRADGYVVVMARTQDTTVVKLSATDSDSGAITSAGVHRDLLERAACANAAGADVLVSIHFDGFSDPSVGGTETFYDSARPFASSNRRLATDLQSALVVRLGAPNRGVVTDDKLVAPTLTVSGQSYGHLIELGPQSPGWVDKPSQMPGALVEPLFVTNPSEAQLGGDPAGQQKIASALESGLVKYFATQA